MADVDGTLLVSSSPVSLPDPGFKALTATLSVEDADIRYRVTGNDPVGGDSGGHLVVKNSYITIKGFHNIEKLRMIRDASTDAKVFYTIER